MYFCMLNFITHIYITYDSFINYNVADELSISNNNLMCFLCIIFHLKNVLYVTLEFSL